MNRGLKVYQDSQKNVTILLRKDSLISIGLSIHEGMSEVAAKKSACERYPRESFLLADRCRLFL
jgi:hypothetical protein